jgi:DNA invertase Pin-like site-specific DNA recombinase
MKVGYLLQSSGAENLEENVSAFEKIGCSRIVVDNSTTVQARKATLAAVVNRLAARDELVVSSIGAIADSMTDLVNLILDLDKRKVRFRSLEEGFDTGAQDASPITTVLERLQHFQLLVDQRRRLAETQIPPGRRTGRPKALTREAVDEARKLIEQGFGIDEVAQKFHVSRATMYRYLEQGFRQA